MFNKTDVACNIQDQYIIDDREFSECFCLRRLGGYNGLVSPFGITPQRSDQKVATNYDPHHPGIYELQHDKGEKRRRRENFVGKRVEKLAPAGSITVSPRDPTVIPICERSEDVNEERKLLQQG